MLFHDIDDGRLHKLVETGKLLVDESLFVEEAIDDNPQIVLGERDRRVVHVIVELFLLGHDIKVAFRAVHLAARSRSIFVTVITCRDIAHRIDDMDDIEGRRKATDGGKAKRVETLSLACVQERVKAREERICTGHDYASSRYVSLGLVALQSRLFKDVAIQQT